MYFKILQEDMKGRYRNFQYKMGLNVDNIPFDEESHRNGLYFCDEDGIMDYISNGLNIAEIEIPDNEQIVCTRNAYKAHSIIIKNVRPLWEIDTFKWLMENKVKFNNYHIAGLICYSGCSNDIVLYLLNNLKLSNNDISFIVNCASTYINCFGNFIPNENIINIRKLINVFTEKQRQ